jgi:large subunit ribosomal protein L18e
MKTKVSKKISKTRLSWLASKKSNPQLKDTILLFKKQKDPFWHYVAKLLARPKRKSIEVNLEKIDRLSKENSTVLVAGKVLGKGEINKKIKLSAFNISEQAKEKLKESGSSFLELEELLQKSPDVKDIKLII